MDFEYVPNTNAVGAVEFHPYMVEVAWNYCQLVLGSALHRGAIEQTLATLAIEIVHKSYNHHQTQRLVLPLGKLFWVLDSRNDLKDHGCAR